MSNLRDAQRLRQGLNPLLTQSLGGPYHNPHPTPLSAISLTSNHLQSAHPTPTGSAIQPYNPQEWVGSPSVSSERPHHYPETQVSPPPPPYSPPYQQRPVSINLDSSPAANISAARIPPTNLHRPSPEPVATTSFPPPPGTRAGSRERRFGIPSLRRHRDQYEQTSPPDPLPPMSISRPVPPPIQIPLAHPTPERGVLSANSQAAPAARRAVSVGALDTPVSARSRSASQTRWEPGMPLPPPPPGPPPASSRSQSVQSVSRSSEPIASPPTRRRPPSSGSALGPVPPTPADWVDHDPQDPAADPRGRSPALTIDTAAAAASSSPSNDPNTSGALSSGSLSRTGAVRHDKTIVQRRAESRTRTQGSIDGSLQPVELTDIVVPNATGLMRRRTINKSTPRSGGRSAHDTPGTGESSLTPRALGSAQHQGTSTPPFSPNQLQKAPMADHPPSIAPKALPTPPPQSRSGSTSRARMAPMASGEETPAASVALRQASITQTSSQFCEATIERFEVFARSEASATSDADRVRLFADFIVNESRIRRERYSPAIGAMGSEIFDLTRDLFRPMSSRRQSGVFQGQNDSTPRSVEPSKSQRTSMEPVQYENAGPSSAPTSASPLNSGSAPGPSNSGNWQQSSYMPSLSPILSMSNSGNGDADSRGRPSSRWWESDSVGQAGHVMERSKRESKYMGVHKEAREALQWSDTPVEVDAPAFPDPGSSSAYPPEKTGWHDQESMLTPQPLRNSAQSFASSSTPTSPNPSHLDISRLVTLPPPYPRHHPAVNNSHPELTATRTAVRQLSDFAEVERTKERFMQTSQKKREEAAKASSERRAALRTNLQREINSGNMTFAEASSIEQDSIESERETQKALGKADFEHFQSQVVIPLNELLTSRITNATAHFDDLARNLFDDVESAADLPQEEGDDKPELLEKLTLLKWIFEAREALHRAIYDLLSDRNDRYREVILTPYRMANNEEKIASAKAFFAEDAEKRQLAFANEVLERTRALQHIVEENVARGVEVQLSAFWDIAPPLRRVLEKIPGDVGGGNFSVQIPGQEYQENPSYHQHPLQYLYSLLIHAEQSTYQFIESQTNLLCKLHEVNEALTHAEGRVIAIQEGGGGDEASREERAKVLMRAQDEKLTSDLQEKVQVVQGQWKSALGEAIKNTKQAVGEWLLQTGGWDEALEEGGVGSV